LVAALNAIARSARSANHAGALRRTSSVIRPQSVPLGLPPFRSALPFRLRCAVSAQSGAATPSAPDVTALAEPRTAPSRCANGATVVAADPRPGVAVAPPAPRPHSAPFRSPARHRLLVRPATTPVSTNQRQRGETPPPVSAPGKPGARLPSPTRRAATSPAPARARRATCASEARLARPHAPVGCDARRAQRGSKRRAVRSQGSLTTQCGTRATNAHALRSPRHPLCQARRGRGQARRARGRWHCAGPAFGLRRVHVPRRLVPSPVPRPASRAFLSQRLRAAVAQSDDMQSVLCFGPRPGIPSARSIHSAALRRVTYRGIVRSAAGAHSGRCQSAAREPTSPAPSRHLHGNSSGATAPIKKAPRPRPAPSSFARAIPPRSIRDCFVSAVPSPGAPRRSLASLVRWGASPRRPAGAVAPRVLAAPLRWRLGALARPCRAATIPPSAPRASRAF
jgi:hypothetical protein